MKEEEARKEMSPLKIYSNHNSYRDSGNDNVTGVQKGQRKQFTFSNKIPKLSFAKNVKSEVKKK